jgi:hypothetical protein
LDRSLISRLIRVPPLPSTTTKGNGNQPPLSVHSNDQSRSGVAVDPSCSEAFNQLKLSKTAKFIIFKLNDEKTSIVVTKQSNDADYDTFLAVPVSFERSNLCRSSLRMTVVTQFMISNSPRATRGRETKSAFTRNLPLYCMA